MNKKRVLHINDLCAGYEGLPSPVLNHVNFNVFENDFLGIIGPNGGGKTTLLKSIMGLLKPLSGEIQFFRNGQPCSGLNIGYMPQTSQIDKKFPISVREVIDSGLAQPRHLLGRYTAEQKQQVEHIAEQMGVAHLLKRPIGNLSGGQLQRVLLGRAIVDNPDVLILDEPNSYVDKKFESDFYKILPKLNETTAIILVSHDVGTVVSLVKNIACVNEGVHYHEGTNITSEWLEKAYSYPVDIISHSPIDGLPVRILHDHSHCNCQTEGKA